MLMPRNSKSKGGKSKGRGRSGGTEGILHGLPDVTVTPRIEIVASSYSQHDELIVAPGCSPRRLLPAPKRRIPVELSFDQLIAPLQNSDGGFPISEALVTGLGLSEPSHAMQHADKEHSPVVGTLLVLLTLHHCKPDPSPTSDLLAQKAQQYLDVRAPGALAAALAGVYHDFPGSDTMRVNFANDGHCRYTVWATLARLAHRRWERGTIVCPRFVVVDLGAALVSHYPVESTWDVVVEKGVLFFSRGENSNLGDWLRQGYVFEAAMVEPYLASEERLLTELHLQKCSFVYQAAPDAAIEKEVTEETREKVKEEATEEVKEEVEVDNSGSDEGDEKVVYLQHRGFEAQPSMDDTANKNESLADKGTTNTFSCSVANSDGSKKCIQLVARHPLHSAREYVEVKKTTHLNGQGGALKKLKYWLQARLANIEHIVVGLTNQQNLRVDELREFSLSDVTPAHEGRIWAGIDALGAAILAATQNDGGYRVSLSNASGSAEVRVQASATDLTLQALAHEAMENFEPRKQSPIEWLDAGKRCQSSNVADLPFQASIQEEHIKRW